MITNNEPLRGFLQIVFRNMDIVDGVAKTADTNAQYEAFRDSMQSVLFSIWKDVDQWGTPMQKQMNRAGWELYHALSEL